MATITLEEQVSQVLRNLDDISRRHVPFAVALALTKTAQRAQAGVLDVMRERFDRPTPFTLNSLRIVSAKRSDPQPFARVYFKDDAFKGTPASRYLGPEVHGGPRSQKRFERALIARGLMKSGQYALPAAGARLDQYGNVRRAQVVQILSALQAFGEQGYQANRTNSTRSRRNGAAAKYFAGEVGGVEGVWQRQTFGFGEGVRPVFVFSESSPQYRVLVPFEKIVENVARARFGGEFQGAIAYAIQSASRR
ncbi:hypothetical protein [Duganella phyllosphaerae]|uniref:Uncharacterized protein n=1 Tax=Duganella phyllosphaerae TaxID=762836 RepID=A0A1E7WZ89_9BURK|nr:hypothetical protein [Duganella phyllosphaerae]OFA05179.1 hypothetical protein DUPY_15820 [Duganella phyllosphaerae]